MNKKVMEILGVRKFKQLGQTWYESRSDIFSEKELEEHIQQLKDAFAKNGGKK